VVLPTAFTAVFLDERPLRLLDALRAGGAAEAVDAARAAGARFLLLDAAEAAAFAIHKHCSRDSTPTQAKATYGHSD
jgi:hypothetical protein